LAGRAFTIRSIAPIGSEGQIRRAVTIRFTDEKHGSFWIQDWQ
jgi:hypothetical protein